MAHEFNVVCLGGGVAGEAITVGLQDSGVTLAGGQPLIGIWRAEKEVREWKTTP